MERLGGPCSSCHQRPGPARAYTLALTCHAHPEETPPGEEPRTRWKRAQGRRCRRRRRPQRAPGVDRTVLSMLSSSSRWGPGVIFTHVIQKGGARLAICVTLNPSVMGACQTRTRTLGRPAPPHRWCALGRAVQPHALNVRSASNSTDAWLEAIAAPAFDGRALSTLSVRMIAQPLKVRSLISRSPSDGRLTPRFHPTGPLACRARCALSPGRKVFPRRGGKNTKSRPRNGKRENWVDGWN